MSRRRCLHLSRYLALAVVLISLATVVIPASVVKADSVITFPDTNLDAAIREAIGKPTGDIYESDVAGLTTLHAYSRNIVDVSGLEYCTNLYDLQLYYNQISDISPLSGLTSLVQLSLDGNQISDISPLSGLTSLIYLGLGYNQIIDISPLSGLTSLTSLYLYDNQISNISPLASLTSLTTLWAQANQISDVSPLSGLTGLGELFLDGNQISDISPLSGLTSLTTLDLASNQISDISPFSGLTSLTDVFLYSNQIGDISPLSDLTSLTFLWVYSNQITDITLLAGLTGLTSLELGDNPIANISVITGLTDLTHLGLAWTQTENLTPLSSLTSLDSLGLRGNEISDVSPLAGLTGLTFLDLSENQISDISPLASLAGLTGLYIFDNQISDISPLSGLTSLTTLWLQDNQISDISPLSGLTSLGELALSGNQISDLEPLVNNSGMSSGDTVYLWRNPLSSTSLDTWIPTLQARGVAVYWDVPNQSPNQPGNVSPANGAIDVSLTGPLQSSGFTDPNAGDTHAASQWQITTVSGNYTDAVFDITDSTHLISIDVGPLSYSTTYYWHVRHQDNHGDWSNWSTETSFTTVPPTPVVKTSGASGITANSARLNGSLTSLGSAGSATVSFVWGTSPGSLTNETASQAMTSTGSFYFDLAGLASGTTYYYEAKAVGDGTTYGAESFFTTIQTPPAVTSSDPIAVTTNSAKLNGDLTSLGSARSVTVSFVWGTGPGSFPNETAGQAMTTIGIFSFDLEGLDPGTTYYYRAKVVGDGEPVYSVEKSFTTGRIPTVESLDPAEGKRKQQLMVTITGTNLDGATNLSFGSEITVDDFEVVSSTQITVEITIGAKAAKGARDVSVTTGWGTATKTDGFSVIGGGGGICSGEAPATPGGPSELTTTLVALGLLFGLGCLFARAGARHRVRA